MKKTALGLLCLFSSVSATDCFEQTLANAPVFPLTCDGDWVLDASAIFWNAHQDGLEYAILNSVRVPIINPDPEEIDELNNLILDDQITPKGKWEFGFRFGLGYTTACDGWDLTLSWTHYTPHAFSTASTSEIDSTTLVTLWSAFAPIQGEVNYARDIETEWEVKLHLIQFELGRNYWISKRGAFRPFIGLAYAYLDQTLKLTHHGGSWSPRTTPNQAAMQNEVTLENLFEGFGVRSGTEGSFHLGCGWKLLGTLSGSILYGHFKTAHKEKNRLANSPFTETPIMENKSYFKASRAMLDLELGIAWTALFCDCAYGVEGSLSWEQHTFFHQNQLFRIVRLGDSSTTESINNSGENSYGQAVGNFSTEGVTLRLSLFF